MKKTNKQRKTIASWSGGKDSCLALYQTIQSGQQIDWLLNFISAQYKRSCFHGMTADLLKTQAKALGIAMKQKEVSADMSQYEKEFKEAVSDLKKLGAQQMVFGDIYLDDHKDWVGRVTNDLGIQALEPLWGRNPTDIIRTFIQAGFKAIIVSAAAKHLDKSFIGRCLDEDLLKDLVRKKICPCGENGEFHTFVIDGPIFKKRIEITQSDIVCRNAYAKYWFLDIQKYELKEKGGLS